MKVAEFSHAQERRSQRTKDTDRNIQAALINEQITRLRVDALEEFQDAGLWARLRWLLLGR